MEKAAVGGGGVAIASAPASPPEPLHSSAYSCASRHSHASASTCLEQRLALPQALPALCLCVRMPRYSRCIRQSRGGLLRERSGGPLRERRGALPALPTCNPQPHRSRPYCLTRVAVAVLCARRVALSSRLPLPLVLLSPPLFPAATARKRGSGFGRGRGRRREGGREGERRGEYMQRESDRGRKRETEKRGGEREDGRECI